MNKFMALAAFGLTAIASVSPAAAQVDQRHYDQQRRIEQGERSGELTRHEAGRLEHQQARIDRTEARMRYRNGGHLNGYQRARLEQRENRASRNIYRQKHDRQYRGY